MLQYKMGNNGEEGEKNGRSLRVQREREREKEAKFWMKKIHI